MLHKSASAFLLLQSCWQLELIIPWCRRCSFLAGFQKQAGFLLVRAEISLLMDFFLFFLPTLQWLQSFEFYDSIDLGWQRPDLKASSLSVSNLTYIIYGTGIACWLERRTRDRKVASSNPGRSGRRIFFFRVNCACCLLFCVRSTPTSITAVARKRPQSFCQKCKRKVTPKNAYNLDLKKSEWADNAAVQAWCGSLSETSSHATRQGKLGHSRLR